MILRLGTIEVEISEVSLINRRAKLQRGDERNDNDT